MPDSLSPEQLTALASSLRRQGRFAEAKRAAERAVRARENNAAGWFNLGAALAGLGQLAASEAAYRKALDLDRGYAEAWNNLGNLLGSVGRTEEAVLAYQKGTAADPSLAPIWSNLGYALCTGGRLGDAEQACRKAIALNPDFAGAWINLANVLRRCGRPSDALGAARRATQLAPAIPEACAGLGNVLMDLKQFPAAIEAYEKALLLAPHDASYHVNLAAGLYRIGADERAAASLRRALQIDPANALASWKLSTFLLEQGALEEGWTRYEARWRVPDAPHRRYPDRGNWQQLAKGARVLLWGEQGVGDEIMYASMAAEAAERGLAVALEADPRLVELFQRSLPAATVVARTDPPGIDSVKFDYVGAVSRPGRWLRSSFDAFPRHDGYLVPDAGRRADFRRRLQRLSDPQGSRLIVGMAWRSANPEFGADKTAALREWRPILSMDRITFVSLQYGDVGAECDEAEGLFRTRIQRFDEVDVFNDIDGLAALSAACDLVITTSNVTAHLTGALGHPGCLLLPKRVGSTWYWFAERGHCPWYPSLTLFKQDVEGDWKGVMQAAANALAARSANPDHN